VGVRFLLVWLVSILKDRSNHKKTPRNHARYPLDYGFEGRYAFFDGWAVSGSLLLVKQEGKLAVFLFGWIMPEYDEARQACLRLN
jgi:hypothetical protein